MIALGGIIFNVDVWAAIPEILPDVAAPFRLILSEPPEYPTVHTTLLDFVTPAGRVKVHVTVNVWKV